MASVFENFITRSKTNGVYRLQSGVPFGVLFSVRSGVRCPLRKWPVTFFEDTGHRTLGAKSDLCQGGYSITLPKLDIFIYFFFIFDLNSANHFFFLKFFFYFCTQVMMLKIGTLLSEDIPQISDPMNQNWQLLRLT